MGLETDTYKFKWGDGVTPWTSLAYFGTGAGFITGSGTNGQVTFWDATTDVTGSANFLYTTALGQLEVLTTSAADLFKVKGSSNEVFVFDNTGTPLLYIDGSGKFASLGAAQAQVFTDKTGNTIVFDTNSTERARINSTGLVMGSSVTIFTKSQDGIQLNPYGTSAGNTGEIRFLELAAGGTNYVGFKASDALAGNVIWTLPTTDSTGTQSLVSNGSGILSWSSITSSNGTPIVTTLAGGLQATASSTSFNAIGGITLNGTEANRQFVMTAAGTVKNLYLVTTSTQSGTGSLVVTVRKNGANTALTLTVSAGATAATFSDVTHTFSVVAGDLLSFQYVNNASVASAQMQTIGVLFI